MEDITSVRQYKTLLTLMRFYKSSQIVKSHLGRASILQQKNT
jgi:hypothetical protein